jgi:hypothetical protein
MRRGGSKVGRKSEVTKLAELRPEFLATFQVPSRRMVSVTCPPFIEDHFLLLFVTRFEMREWVANRGADQGQHKRYPVPLGDL